LQPGLHDTARSLGHIEEADPGAPAGVLPSDLAGHADRLRLTGKRELEINLVVGWKTAGGLDQSSAFAEVAQDGVGFGSAGASDIHSRTDGSARRAAAFAGV